MKNLQGAMKNMRKWEKLHYSSLILYDENVIKKFAAMVLVYATTIIILLM